MLVNTLAHARMWQVALLLFLLEATPANKRLVSRCRAILPLLRLLARCADDASANLRIHLLRTAATLGEYTVSGAEALLLFRLVAAPEVLLPPPRPEADVNAAERAAERAGVRGWGVGERAGERAADEEAERRAEDARRAAGAVARGRQRDELQMQLLFVLGCIAERSAPRSFYSLDGNERLQHGPLTSALPPATRGYTIAFWMRLSAQPEGENEVRAL